MSIHQHIITKPDGSVNYRTDRTLIATLPNVPIPLSTTGAINSVNITSAGSYATMPTFGATIGSGATFTGHMGAGAISLVTAQSGSGNYMPGDQIQLTGGTFTQPIVISVLNTQVVSAAINSGGSGGTPGTQIVTGTTGTGIKFQASVFISGGAMASVNSITVGGIYTTNPTNLNNEPVTGAGLSGATLSIKMGVNQIDPTYNNIGDYTVLPTAPISQGSTTGTGTGAQFNVNSWIINSVAVPSGGSGYTASSQFTITGGGGTGGGAGTLTLNRNGVSTTAHVTMNLPTNYCVNVNTRQQCGWYTQNETNSGFDIVFYPYNASSSVAAVNASVSIFA